MFNMQKEKKRRTGNLLREWKWTASRPSHIQLRDWIQVFPSRTSMTNESGRHYCSCLDDLQWISEVFPLSFRKFLQLKKERKWWKGCFTVQWQQRKKKFCPELNKRLPLVGIRWGENAMQTLLQQDYREWLLICVCNWFYKLQNWMNLKPREIKWP